MTIPIRQEIEILPADAPTKVGSVIIDDDGNIRQNRLTLGWTVTEKISIGVINPRAISKLTIKK